jgi:hypothetical protein
MASARLLTYQRAAAKIPTLPKGRSYTMSVNSDFHDRVFRRTQSAKMGNLAWEGRTKALRSWCEIAALGAGLTVFMAFCVLLATI